MKPSQFFRNVDNFYLKHYIHGLPIGEFLEDGTLIRSNDQKQVYAIMDGYKRPIENIKVFYQHGWDFDQVKVLTNNKNLLDEIPTGEPLN